MGEQELLVKLQLGRRSARRSADAGASFDAEWHLSDEGEEEKRASGLVEPQGCAACGASYNCPRGGEFLPQGSQSQLKRFTSAAVSVHAGYARNKVSSHVDAASKRTMVSTSRLLPEAKKK